MASIEARVAETALNRVWKRAEIDRAAMTLGCRRVSDDLHGSLMLVSDGPRILWPTGSVPASTVFVACAGQGRTVRQNMR